MGEGDVSGGGEVKECQDCYDDCKRRIKCPRCKLLVCPWCWHHVHASQAEMSTPPPLPIKRKSKKKVTR